MLSKNRYLSFFLTRSLFFGFGISYLLHLQSYLVLVAFPLGALLGYVTIPYLTNQKNDFLSIIGTILLLFLYLISFGVLTSNFYLTHTPSYFLLLPFIGFLLYGVKLSQNSISRYSELSFWIWLFLLIIIIVSLVSQFSFLSLLPLKGSILKFLRLVGSSYLLSVFPLLLIDGDTKEIQRGYLYGVLSIYLVLLFLLGILGHPLSEIYRYPQFALLKRITFFSTLDKQEYFLAFIWYIDLVVSSLFLFWKLYQLLPKIYFYIFILFFYGMGIYLLGHYQLILWIHNYIIWGILGLFILFILVQKKNQVVS